MDGTRLKQEAKTCLGTTRPSLWKGVASQSKNPPATDRCRYRVSEGQRSRGPAKHNHPPRGSGVSGRLSALLSVTYAILRITVRLETRSYSLHSIWFAFCSTCCSVVDLQPIIGQFALMGHAVPEYIMISFFAGSSETHVSDYWSVRDVALEISRSRRACSYGPKVVGFQSVRASTGFQANDRNRAKRASRKRADRRRKIR